jgi:hypothetical protein
VPDGTPYSGIPNPFAWWLFLPVYLFALLYFVVRLRQTIRAGGERPLSGVLPGEPRAFRLGKNPV